VDWTGKKKFEYPCDVLSAGVPKCLLKKVYEERKEKREERGEYHLYLEMISQ
jgi:hypothetical protein